VCMFEKLLVPFDFSVDSRYVIQCLKKIPKVKEIILLHVIYSKYPSNLECGVSPDADYARLRLNELVKDLENSGMQVQTIIKEITGGEIVDVINQVAFRESIPLVMMGRRGQGVIESLILGSVASDVLRYGKTDLLLVHSHKAESSNDRGHDPPCPDLFSNVMICTDFSDPEIGYRCRDELPWIQKATLFHAVTTGTSNEEVQSSIDAGKLQLEKITEAFSTIRIPVQVYACVGNAAEEIISRSSQEKSSLIVLKSTGKKGLLTNLLGSTTGHVARNAHSPVLVLRSAHSSS